MLTTTLITFLSKYTLTLIFNTPLDKTADDKFQTFPPPRKNRSDISLPQKMAWHFMQIVSFRGNMNEKSNPIFWEKYISKCHQQKIFYPEPWGQLFKTNDVVC